MALTGKITHEFGIRSPAAKFFNFIAKQIHHVQNITDRVHETKVHEGDWESIGSIRHWTYIIDGKVTQAKESFEVVDEQNKLITFNVFDGDVSKHYKLFKVTLQVNDKDNGTGAVPKWSVEYEKIKSDIAPPYGYLDFLTKLTEDSDAHLLKA